MNEQVELRHLRYFLAVAETLHFTRAAERLGIAQPPLSQQIKRLEQLVGHPLFERTTRGVKLTLAGKLLAERARGTLNRVEDDLAQVRRLGRGEEGTLTVGFPGSVMFTDVLPQTIQGFRGHYPGVALRLRELTTSALIAALLDGSMDVALLRDGDPTQGIELHPLMKEQFVAVLPAKHPLAKKPRVDLAKLAREPFLLFSRSNGPLAYDRTVQCCERNGFRPNIVQEAPQWATVVRLVAAGVGVSLAPAGLGTLAIQGAVCRPITTSCTTSIDLGMTSGSASPLIDNFIQIARSHLTS